MLKQAVIKNLIMFMAKRKFKGHSDEDISNAVDHAMHIYDAEHPSTTSGATPFLDWLKNGGLEQVMQILMMLLPLFAQDQPAG